MKNVEKSRRKIFTKNYEKDIIQLKYNLLNKNYEFYEREEFVMKETEDIVLSEIFKGLNKTEKIKVRLFSKIFIKVYKLGIMYGFNNK